MKSISRRDFLKGSLATAVGAAAMGLIGTPSVTASAEEAAADSASGVLTAES